MKIDLADFERHNVVRRGDQLRTRRGLYSIATPSTGCVFVAGFSVESPFTTEPWHYLFEQSTTTRAVTMRVHTEEFVEVFSYALGVMQADPVITHAVVDNQIVINSPSFSSPLYGGVGAGVFAMERLESEEEDYDAIDAPAGHVASLGNRVVVAQANALYVNRARTDGDPRTFIGENAVALSGVVYDLFEGPDGALYVFTSRDVQVIRRDVISTDVIQPLAFAIAGLSTSRPKNAVAAAGAIAILQRDGLAIMRGSAVEHLSLVTYAGKRHFSHPVDQEDMRTSGELHATTNGVLVAFRGARGFFVEVDLRDRSRTFVWSTETAFNVVGTLRTRGGETLILMRDRVVMPMGIEDFDGYPVHGVLCGRASPPEGARPVMRRLTIATDNVGQAVGVAVAGETVTKAVPARSSDAVVGTSTWDAGASYTGRDLRTVRCTATRARRAQADIEILVAGGDRRIGASADVELTGQGRGRKDRR